MNTKPLSYTCPKCGNKAYKIGQMRATGGFLSKIFDIQTEKYTSITCSNCTYTEFYKASTKALSNIFDFFTN
jgi:predicted nucleic-acid-binding Zn-ribbon protein